jgi:hypothetical protein
MFDLDGPDASEALVPVDSSSPAKSDDAPVPHHHDCDKCQLCQIAAHLSNAAPPPPLLLSFLPLNHLYIATPKVYVSLNVRLTSDSRGPPAIA